MEGVRNVRSSMMMSVREEGRSEDRFSDLPEEVRVFFFSNLTAKEAVRTSILSKRWKDTWKFIPNLSFDQKAMPNDEEIRRYVESTPLNTRLENGRRRAREGRHGNGDDPIGEAASRIERVLSEHSVFLQSCSIKHMTESLWEAKNWVKKLFDEKKVQELYMECYSPHMEQNYQDDYSDLWLDSLSFKLSFEDLAGCQVVEFKNYPLLNISSPPPPSISYPQNLKTINLTDVSLRQDAGVFLSECLSLENITLKNCNIQGGRAKIYNHSVKVLNLVKMNTEKLEVFAMGLEELVIDSVFRPLPLEEGDIMIAAPNLKVLRYCCTEVCKVGSNMATLYIRSLRDILQRFCNAVILGQYTFPSLYENLESLYLKINTKNKKDIALLVMILKLCLRLQNLVIENEKVDDERLHPLYDRETNILQQLYPPNMFWRMMDQCECVTDRLKRVYVGGVKGKAYEVEFVKSLILSCQVIESITISFDDNCTWQDAIAMVCLLSFPKKSKILSITLEPAKTYSATVGGSFQNWISTLKC